MSTPEIITGWFNVASDAEILPSGPNHSNATLCNRNATANVATSITAGEYERNGRNTIRSITSERARTTAKHRTIPTPTGQPCSDANASAYAPAMTSCP